MYKKIFAVLLITTVTTFCGCGETSVQTAQPSITVNTNVVNEEAAVKKAATTNTKTKTNNKNSTVPVIPNTTIKNLIIDGNGNLVSTNSNNTYTIIGNVKGQKGDKGDTGAPGSQGEKGADGRGIASCNLDSEGNLIVTYTDGTTQNAGNLLALVSNPDSDNASDFVFDNDGNGTKLIAYNGNLSNAVIPEKCTEIGERAFYNKAFVTGVKIPINVTSIGDQAFSNCTGLTQISFPISIISIGNQAFSGCNYLTDIILFDNVTNIGNNAFSSCRNLTNVAMNDSVTSIGVGAFGRCPSLINVYLSNNITNIEPHTFAECTSLEYIKMPDNVTSIGDGAFAGCTSLEYIEIPDSVTSIGEWAFSRCPFNSINYKGVIYSDKQSLITALRDNGVSVADNAFDSSF